MTVQTKGRVQAEIERLGPWFHNLHLPCGTQTCPDHPIGDFPGLMWELLAPHIPADLTGASVLDIGCNAGFYSFELARRGASVHAIDIDAHYLRQAAWAAERYGLTERIAFEERSVYSLAREDRTYDVVLFMGVFYHLRYPLLGLDLVARRAGTKLVFQSLMTPGDEAIEPPEDQPLDDRTLLTRPDWPKMSFIERRLANDPTNWWAPNHAAVMAMLRTCGMQVTARPGRELYVCVPGSATDPLTEGLVRGELAQVLDGVRP